MTDDDKRDRYTPKHTGRKTPVSGVGVIPSITKPAAAPETWEGTRTAMPRIPGAPETVVEGIDRRTRETKNAVHESLDRVDALRTETRADINRVEVKVDNTSEKVDAVIEVVGDLRQDVGEQGGQNEIIIDMLKEARDTRVLTQTVVTTSQLNAGEVDKSRQLTAIEIDKAKQMGDIEALAKWRADRREMIKAIVYKSLAAAGVVWAFVSVTYLSNCGGG